MIYYYKNVANDGNGGSYLSSFSNIYGLIAASALILSFRIRFANALNVLLFPSSIALGIIDVFLLLNNLASALFLLTAHMPNFVVCILVFFDFDETVDMATITISLFIYMALGLFYDPLIYSYLFFQSLHFLLFCLAMTYLGSVYVVLFSHLPDDYENKSF